MTNTVALSLKLGWMVTYRHTNFILNVFAVFVGNASSVGNYFIRQRALLFIQTISRDSRQCSARRCYSLLSVEFVDL
jgi:predicted ATPase